MNKQVKLKPALKVNQTVGMDAKYVFPLLLARFVKVQTLPFQKVFVHVKRNR
jgi:antitoxin component of RelBE/YafQ-DinJ toxin-antitoxin module